MFKYESMVVEASSSIKVKLGAKDINIIDDIINRRASDGWELVTYSYSIMGVAQFLLTFRKEIHNN